MTRRDRRPWLAFRVDGPGGSPDLWEYADSVYEVADWLCAKADC